MINPGSKVILETAEAIYSPCEVVSMSRDNIVVEFCAGTKRDRKTGKMVQQFKKETIPFRKITHLSERH